MAVVTKLTELDLQYAAQQAGCALAELGEQVASDFFYAKKCAEANLRKLKLAQGFMMVLENYMAEDVEILASTKIKHLTGTTGTISLYISNGTESIITVPYNTSLYQTALDLKAAVGTAYSVTVTVVALGDTADTTTVAEIILTAEEGSGVDGNDIQVKMVNTAGNNTFNITGYTYLKGGKDAIEEGDNCVTEEDMQDIILPTLGSLLSITFPNPGLITGIEETPVAPAILIETGDNLLTEDSNNLLRE